MGARTTIPEAVAAAVSTAFILPSYSDSFLIKSF
jgi:hypothetical protein